MTTAHETWHRESRLSPALPSSSTRVQHVSLAAPCSPDCPLLTVLRTPESIVTEPSWETMQVGETQHARFGEKALKLNHADAPNTRIEVSGASAASKALRRERRVESVACHCCVSRVCHRVAPLLPLLALALSLPNPPPDNQLRRLSDLNRPNLRPRSAHVQLQHNGVVHGRSVPRLGDRSKRAGVQALRG